MRKKNMTKLICLQEQSLYKTVNANKEKKKEDWKVSKLWKK